MPKNPVRTSKKHLRRMDADDFAYESGDIDWGLDETDPDAPSEGDRWSTWDSREPLQRGPEPYPDWLVTEAAAVDYELGVLKTGKEADVFLIERAVPGTDRRCLLAAKRYRDAEHTMFHRNAEYLEGRGVAKSREARAVANRTRFGKQVIAGQWAAAEFTALVRLCRAGASVPYPVQIDGTEILMEFIGEPDGTAAPRLAQLRPDPQQLAELWRQLGFSLSLMARDGFAHGDLSAYNLIVTGGRLVLIDVPQVIDVIANPRGREFIERDVHNVGKWFTARGLEQWRVEELIGELCLDAGLR